MKNLTNIKKTNIKKLYPSLVMVIVIILEYLDFFPNLFISHLQFCAFFKPFIFLLHRRLYLTCICILVPLLISIRLKFFIYPCVYVGSFVCM